MARIFTALALVIAAVSGMAQDVSNIQLETYWFVFLVRGDNRSPKDEAQSAKDMAAHLGNLTRMANEGKAVAAGPFEGSGDRRGIVILKGDVLKSKKDVIQEFAEDPFVKAGRLRVEVHPWMTQKGSIHKWREPIEMKPHVFVVLDRGEERSTLPEQEADALQAQHLRHIFGMMEKDDLGVAGPFGDDTDMRGLLFFKHGDLDKAKKAVALDPLISRKRLKATYLVLWLAAGTVGD